MELLAAFPDAEDIGLELLASVAATALVTPVELEPPLIVVRRVGGANEYFTDRPRLQVQAFGASHAQARDLAEQARQLILAAPATTVAGASIDRTWTESAPVFVDYGTPAVHRYIATYRLEYRRPR
jgi:hypothetical protein